MEYHGDNRFTFKITLDEGISGKANFIVIGKSPLIYVHGILLFIAWYLCEIIIIGVFWLI
jgi:hypothetical protein